MLFGSKVDGVFKYGVVSDYIYVIIGELVPGNRRSENLIVKLIEDHKDMFKNYEYVVIDSPPGTGVGLYSILRYSSHVIAVTEPTPLGVNDLSKFLMLVSKYGGDHMKVLVVINKYGIPGNSYEELRRVIKSKGLNSVEIPYSDDVFRSYLMGKPLIEVYQQSDVVKKLRKIIEFIK